MALPIKEIIEGAGLLVGLFGGLFKHKPFKLLRWNLLTRSWERCHIGPLSHRNCEKMMNELIHLGADPVLFTILRESAINPTGAPAGWSQ